MSDGEDNNEGLVGLPTQPEEIPQVILVHPPKKPAHPAGHKIKNDFRVIPKAGIHAIGGSHLPYKTQKRIIADPPTSITGVLPSHWPALRGASEWILNHDVHGSEMRWLYVEGKALQPHKHSPDHTVAMLHIDKYVRSLPDLHADQEVHPSDPAWTTDIIHCFNKNPSRIP
ncbi:hypothetical protein M422DRAFT_264975 [Sphaerobolus stellatus SS14]|uniref:Uncharacterized protein n=1 Tax=Sphaerobolus stellatus (strain SS14) TaxID=990650 RepID=A0A0C9TS70_SPHS4|nr:hypothetical protein M422DRAFT_264975 [Sphaerobolus stellatus SS14]